MVTTNVADVLPCGIEMVARTIAELLLLERATVVPFGPAGPDSFTVPSTEFPPSTVVGFSITEESVAGATVRTAD